MTRDTSACGAQEFLAHDVWDNRMFLVHWENLVKMEVWNVFWLQAVWNLPALSFPTLYLPEQYPLCASGGPVFQVDHWVLNLHEKP